MPFIVMVTSALIWLLGWTPPVTEALGQPAVLVVAVIAPAAFGLAAWVRVGRSVTSALSWTIPFAGFASLAHLTPPPLGDVMLFLAAWFWVSMLFFGRVINWWEANILRSRRYGRLPRQEQAFDDELERLLDAAIAHGTQFERHQTNSRELRSRLEEIRRHVLALRSPDDEWEEARRALVEFVTAATRGATSDHGSNEQLEARERAASALRSYQEARRRLHRDRLQPWRGFELM